MINIAVDGPSGAGKSTLAKAIAAQTGLIYVDTGALYRAIGLAVCRAGIGTDQPDAVIPLLPSLSVSFRHDENGQRVFLGEEEVTGLIRTPEISRYASFVSAIPAVRAKLLSLQKDIAASENVIMDGRDIGTVILPHAQVKIFLSASDARRAKRRYDELIAKGLSVTEEQIAADMKTRDEHDAGRAIAPAVPADDAILLDNSDLDEVGTVDAALRIIRQRLAEQGLSL